MKVLVTGGSGYIGSVLTGRLLEAGHEVTVLDNQKRGSLNYLCADQKLSVVLGDVRDVLVMRRLVPHADAIVHLAALVGYPSCEKDPWLAETVNVDAINVLRQILSKQQLVIFPNTNSGYGNTEGICSEDTPLKPLTIYAETKAYAEKLITSRLNSISLRLATVFGMSPCMRWDLLVNSFVRTALKDRYLVIFDGHFKRNYVHVRDVADAMLFCLENGQRLAGKAYNLGNDDANLTKCQLANLVTEQVPNLYVHAAPVGTDPDQRNYVVSSERLRKAGFEANRGLREGISELIKGYACDLG